MMHACVLTNCPVAGKLIFHKLYITVVEPSKACQIIDSKELKDR